MFDVSVLQNRFASSILILESMIQMYIHMFEVSVLKKKTIYVLDVLHPPILSTTRR